MENTGAPGSADYYCGSDRENYYYGSGGLEELVGRYTGTIIACEDPDQIHDRGKKFITELTYRLVEAWTQRLMVAYVATGMSVESAGMLAAAIVGSTPIMLPWAEQERMAHEEIDRIVAQRKGWHSPTVSVKGQEQANNG